MPSTQFATQARVPPAVSATPPPRGNEITGGSEARRAAGIAAIHIRTLRASCDLEKGAGATCSPARIPSRSSSCTGT